MVSAYTASLNRKLAEERVDQTDAQNAIVRDRLAPLKDRLARLLGTIPPELQKEGLSLTSLQTSLRGRWGARCHPGELGMALRSLGFERRRCWKNGESFSALWYRVK